MKQKTSMRAGRRPSPGGTKLLFAGTISPMICPVDGSTEGRHEKKQTDGLLGVDDALIVTFCFDNFALCVPAMKKNDKNQRPFGRSAPRVYARILFFSTPHVLFF